LHYPKILRKTKIVTNKSIYCIFPKKSLKFPKKFPKNPKKNPIEFPKNFPKISLKNPKIFQKKIKNYQRISKILKISNSLNRTRRPKTFSGLFIQKFSFLDLMSEKRVDTTKIDKKQIKRGPTQLNFKLFCIIKYPTFFLTDMERESIRTDAKTLSNLRSEHARLKDDFRSLFTSNDRIKTEYCNLQSDYKTLKTTHNQLKLAQTELKGIYIIHIL
jgi:hypothetical protein